MLWDNEAALTESLQFDSTRMARTISEPAGRTTEMKKRKQGGGDPFKVLPLTPRQEIAVLIGTGHTVTIEVTLRAAQIVGFRADDDSQVVVQTKHGKIVVDVKDIKRTKRCHTGSDTVAARAAKAKEAEKAPAKAKLRKPHKMAIKRKKARQRLAQALAQAPSASNHGFDPAQHELGGTDNLGSGENAIG